MMSVGIVDGKSVGIRRMDVMVNYTGYDHLAYGFQIEERVTKRMVIYGNPTAFRFIDKRRAIN